MGKAGRRRELGRGRAGAAAAPAPAPAPQQRTSPKKTGMYMRTMSPWRSRMSFIAPLNVSPWRRQSHSVPGDTHGASTLGRTAESCTVARSAAAGGRESRWRASDSGAGAKAVTAVVVSSRTAAEAIAANIGPDSRRGSRSQVA